MQVFTCSKRHKSFIVDYWGNIAIVLRPLRARLRRQSHALC